MANRRVILALVAAATTARADSLAEREERCTYDWTACGLLRIEISREDAGARARYERACADGAAIQCAFVGDWIFEHSLTEQRDLGDPSVWFRKACRAGNRYGCERFAWLLPEKSREAFVINEDLCKRDWPSGCMRVGYRLEWGDARVRKRATALFARACDLGEPAGCWQAGLDYAHDTDASADVKARWRDRMDAACTAGNAESCGALADIYRCGIGTSCDVRRAISYEDKTRALRPPPPRNSNSVGSIARCRCKD